MNVLGDTLDKIAFEKAGIMKKGVTAVFAPQVPEAEAVPFSPSFFTSCLFVESLP